MSGELKSQNINMKKAATQQSHHPAQITQTIPSNTTIFKKDISQRTRDTIPV
jgi:hypothetical protein